jgi:hypothetical protein
MRSELFGDHTTLANGQHAPNGFEAIAELDTNDDAMLNSADSAWGDLLLWLDANHDGRSTSEELVSIGTSEIEAISTEYRWSPRRDRFGNEFRYAGEVVISGHDGSAMTSTC